MVRPRGRAGTQLGSALVEFALIAPLFFLIVFALVEIGIVFSDHCSASYACHAAVRYAVVRGADASGRVSTDTTGMNALVTSLLWTAQSSGTSISVNFNPDDGVGSAVTVSVSLTYTTGIPFSGLSTIKVGSTSTGTIIF